MAKLEKKQKQSAKAKKQKRIKELFVEIRLGTKDNPGLNSIKYGYIVDKALKELEDLVK